MKKVSLILCTLLLITMLIPYTISASPYIIEENPVVNMPKTEPKIDGIISPGEWTAYAKLNENTFGYFGTTYQLLTGYGIAYFAYTNNGLYVAIDYTDLHDAYCIRSLNYATKLVYADSEAKNYHVDSYLGDPVFPTQTSDGIPLDYCVRPNWQIFDHDGKEINLSQLGTTEYLFEKSLYDLILTSNSLIPTSSKGRGQTDKMYEHSYWNGDVFAVSINPQREFYSNVVAPQYTFGVKADGTVMTAVVLYKPNQNEDSVRIDSATDITTVVNAKGYITDDKLVIEALIPWSRIAADCNKTANNYGLGVANGVGIQFNEKEMCANDVYHTAAITFYDRYLDIEIGDEDILGRFITTNQIASSGIKVGDMGITLLNSLRKIESFNDVSSTAWYAKGVSYCVENSFMSGTSSKAFSPNENLTRAMFVTILSKIDRADVSMFNGTVFTDVPAGKWYSKPIAWAAAMGYASGTGGGKFSPNAPVTRETLAQFFYTYAKANNYETNATANLTKFSDANTISNWAKNAVSWAIASGLISGTSTTTISPKATATRAQVAVIVMNFVEKNTR